MKSALSNQAEERLAPAKTSEDGGSSPRLKVAFAPYYVKENPYQGQLQAHLDDLGTQVFGMEGDFFTNTVIKRARFDVLHLHWLDGFFQAPNQVQSFVRLAKFIIALFVLKLSGVKIVWTTHNLRGHENLNPLPDRICTSLVIKLSDAVVVHGEIAKQELLAQFNAGYNDKVFVIPHGNYIKYYRNVVDRLESRKRLGIDSSKIVFLFLGIIRPYKGVPELIEIFKQLHRDDVELVIAGKLFNQEIGIEIEQKIQNCPYIKFIPGFVPDDQIQVYMNACDAVVFPYRNLLTSGAAILAMSFGKACVAPRIGCLKEALDDSGAFLYDPDSQDGLLQAINQAVARQADLAAMGQYNYQTAEQWSWEKIASMTTEIYRKYSHKN